MDLQPIHSRASDCFLKKNYKISIQLLAGSLTTQIGLLVALVFCQEFFDGFETLKK
jgi:hypothetical protein